MTIILERLCISPTEAIRQGDKPYMQQDTFYGVDNEKSFTNRYLNVYSL